MNRIRTFVSVSAVATAVGVLAGVGGPGGGPGADPALVVRLVGTAEAEIQDLSDLTDAPGADEALCFDLVMEDARTGKVIGTATDCLINVQEVGDGLSLTAITIFNFPGGTLINEGQTTVQPTTIGSNPVTHITGAIPDPGVNTFVGGTGRFANATGSVRLSGAVNLSDVGDGIISFDCLFVVDED